MCTKLLRNNYSIEIMRSNDERGAFHDGVTETPCILVNEPGARKRRLGGFAEAEEFIKQQRGPMGEGGGRRSHRAAPFELKPKGAA